MQFWWSRKKATPPPSWEDIIRTTIAVRRNSHPDIYGRIDLPTLERQAYWAAERKRGDDAALAAVVRSIEATEAEARLTALG